MRSENSGGEDAEGEAVTSEGWRQAVEMAHNDAEMKDLLVRLLVEQDAAKNDLSARFGWIGLSWAGLVENILTSLHEDEL